MNEQKPTAEAQVIIAENAVIDGARYIPYVHKHIVRQPWQRATYDAAGFDTLEEALDTARYWLSRPSFWTNALAVRRSDGEFVAWTDGCDLSALVKQIAKNDAEPPR